MSDFAKGTNVPTNDLISRQAAIDAVKNTQEPYVPSFSNEVFWCVKALSGLPSAQPEQRWIPCDTREPELVGDYLLYRPHFWGANIGQITICYWSGKHWSDNYRHDAERFLQVIHGMAWMSLPEPWKGDAE